MKNFVSVGTTAARFQDISLNPQKLAGMCAKLKCCLNYEVDDYVEAGKKMPSREVMLQTLDSDYYLFKTDILAGLCTYSTDKNIAANLETISAERARQIIEMNKRGEKPENLCEDGKAQPERPIDLLADTDVSRFDKSKKKKKKPAQNRQRQPRNNDQPRNEQPRNEQQRGPRPYKQGQQPRQPQQGQPQQQNQPQQGQPQQGQPQQGQQQGQPRQQRRPHGKYNGPRNNNRKERPEGNKGSES